MNPPINAALKPYQARMSQADVIYKCWMYKRSRFYSRIRVLTSQKWQLRFFTLDKNGLNYSRGEIEEDPKKQKMIIKYMNLFEAVSVQIINEQTFTFAIHCQKRDFVLKCLSRDHFYGMLESIQRLVESFQAMTPERKAALELAAQESMRDMDVSPHLESEHNLLILPRDSSPLARATHYFLYPLKAMIYYTIPDAHPIGDREVKYFRICLTATIWLAVLSFLMTYCMETIGEVVGLSSGVMGLTFGAAGTSFPNLLSSVLVAKQGQGNMAVSNAFGSNIFCIFMGLGFPWTLYVLVHGGNAYEGLKDDGLVISIMALITLLALFLVMMYATKFVLYRWMGYLFNTLYVVFVIYSILDSIKWS
jgi:Ca2+/Na+ antiporter